MVNMTDTATLPPGAENGIYRNGSAGHTSNAGTTAQWPSLSRADETDELLSIVKDAVVQFIRAADDQEAKKQKIDNTNTFRSSLVDSYPPEELSRLLESTTLFPREQPGGREAATALMNDVLRYSVNTWHRGFLDKLYAAPTPIGVAAETLLSALNTNVHVYGVSPALTVVEKKVGVALARLFGFKGPRAGAVSQPGGSAANQSSLAIARNCLFPETKEEGVGARRFVLFTSAHGHYSVEKAAQMAGLGVRAVRNVAVDSKGAMRADALEEAIVDAKARDETPFYVNATAGTTVFGVVDPLSDIADICARHHLWMHVDASWGGGMIFSEKQKHKLAGIEQANSIAFCPHKMLNVPMTCSVLIGKDLRDFHQGMTLRAGYLFHDPDEEIVNGEADPDAEKYWDLADLTPQCGRKGDSFKLALSWAYYGTSGFAAHVDAGFDAAALLASLIAANPRMHLVSENPPPCLQVCFYFSPAAGDCEESSRQNSRNTAAIAKALVPRGFMVDYAPGESGKFLRVVVNGRTSRETVQELVQALIEVGDELGL